MEAPPRPTLTAPRVSVPPEGAWRGACAECASEVWLPEASAAIAAQVTVVCALCTVVAAVSARPAAPDAPRGRFVIAKGQDMLQRYQRTGAWVLHEAIAQDLFLLREAPAGAPARPAR